MDDRHRTCHRTLRTARAGALLGTALLLAGCGALRPLSGPPPVATPPAARESVETPPRELPPALTRIDPLAPGIPGLDALPPGEVAAAPVQTGIASWYGRPFHGRRTASGERYDMHALTAAHRTLPMPSYALVRTPANDRQVIVRINDRGPFKRGRIVDLSRAAAKLLGIEGIAPVELRPLTINEARSNRATPGAEDVARDDPR
jgi:rare lipoprotein A